MGVVDFCYTGLCFRQIGEALMAMVCDAVLHSEPEERCRVRIVDYLLQILSLIERDEDPQNRYQEDSHASPLKKWAVAT